MPNTPLCHALRLPLNFEKDKLYADLTGGTRENWQQHFNSQDYSGKWTSIAFYSPSGEVSDIRTSGGDFLPTALLQSCPYINSILASLNFQFESVRFLRLASGSIIHPHRDRGLAYSFGVFRLHIPVETGPDVDFIVDGHSVPMRAGECWYANFDLPHSVNNRGATDRIHLVIDGIRNEWTDELFARAGYDFGLDIKKEHPETIIRMIAELERMNTDTSRTMIAELKSKLHA